jgi:hypothetical protein
MLSSQLCSVRPNTIGAAKTITSLSMEHIVVLAPGPASLYLARRRMSKQRADRSFERARARVPPVSQHQPRHFGIMQER